MFTRSGGREGLGGFWGWAWTMAESDSAARMETWRMVNKFLLPEVLYCTPCVGSEAVSALHDSSSGGYQPPRRVPSCPTANQSQMDRICAI